jgi:hypothetical protein
MEQTLRNLGEELPLAAATITLFVLAFAAMVWIRRSRADMRPNMVYADSGAFAEYTYSRIRARYLEALKQTSLVDGLAILLALVSVVLITIGFVILARDGSSQQGQERSLAYLLAGGAMGVLSAMALIHATSDRKALITIVETVRIDWKLREAVRLAESIEEREIRTRLLAALSFQLSGAVPTQSVLREMVTVTPRDRTPSAAVTPGAAPAPTYFQWRAHFRRCGRKHGRRIVLERDYL